MERFELTILGCGSAKPTTRHFPSAQLVNVREKLFLVDCGEGTQLQLNYNRARFTRIDNVFISHLHGDHCFGLIGLISTLDLLGRTADLHVHAPAQFENILFAQINFFCRKMGYKVVFHAVDTETKALIYDDRSLSVYSLPLQHRVPCAGFLFVEKQGKPHIVRDMIDYYHIPLYAINSIKEGCDWELPDGTVVPFEKLTTPASPARSYAYCSDTAYVPELADMINDVDLLYHEATFADDAAYLTSETMHSTARQAATVARDARAGRLVIGHYSSRYDDVSALLGEACEVFPNTMLANEGLVLKL